MNMLVPTGAAGPGSTSDHAGAQDLGNPATASRLHRGGGFTTFPRVPVDAPRPAEVMHAMLRSVAWMILALLSVWPAAVGAQETRPWVVAAMEAAADNQPRTGFVARLEYGRFLTPDLTLAVRLGGEWAGSGSGPRENRTATAEPGLSAALGIPTLRVGLTGSVSALLGAPGVEVPVLWDARGHVRLDPATVLRLGAARARYKWTAAAIDTLLLVRSYEIAVDRAGDPGWAGELVGRRENFGDDNPVLTAYGWVLAPLSRSARTSLRLGYAATWQDAKHSNWVPTEQRFRAGPGVAPGADGIVPGRYAPYYTPHRVVSHSVLGAGALAVGAGWFKVDGSVGVHATEWAPSLHAIPPDPTVPELRFHQREFTPYRLGVEWSTPLDGGTSLVLGAGYARTAYYGLGTARLTLARSL